MDVNYRSYADVNDVLVFDETLKPDDLAAFSDTLKFSKVEYAKAQSCVIWGCKEDCIDMNRYCNNIIVEDCVLIPSGKFGVTIKGGTRNVVLRDVTFHGHGKEVDIDIGNWSDQSAEMTTGITLSNVKSDDGRPVVVRVLWGDDPNVIGGNVLVKKYPLWMVWIYRLLRKYKLVP